MVNYDKNKLPKRQKEAINDIEGLLFYIDTYVILNSDKDRLRDKCIRLGEYIFNSSYNKEDYEGAQSKSKRKGESKWKFL